LELLTALKFDLKVLNIIVKDVLSKKYNKISENCELLKKDAELQKYIIQGGNCKSVQKTCDAFILLIL
jgi:hypothetical protein